MTSIDTNNEITNGARGCNLYCAVMRAQTYCECSSIERIGIVK